MASATCACAASFTGPRCELARFQPVLGVGAPCDGSLFATRISADGSTVIGTCGSGTAFLWTVGQGFVDLGISSATSIDSIPFAVNSDGSAFLSRFTRADGSAGVFRWNVGPSFADLYLQPTNTLIYADQGSGDLATFVGAYVDSTLAAGDQLGFLFTAATGLQTLAVPAGSQFGCGTFGISADGTVLAGVCYDAANLLHVSRWRVQDAGIALDLLDTSATTTYGNAVSGDGNVIVGYLITDNVAHQLRFAGAGPLQDLGALATAQTSQALESNLDGSVIVGVAQETSFPFNDFATVWDAQNGLRAVGDALSAAGIDTSGWALTTALGVSADGKTIVGNGASPDSQQRFWLARLY